MKLYFTLAIIVALICSACTSKTAEKDSAYIGGEIVNPTSNYIILSKNDKVIDTLVLDQNNQFGKYVEGICSGIYAFRHPPGNQIMYLEPRDSILIWVNTMDFDQSLNFSGRGARKSKLLLDMYQQHQKNNELVLSYFKIQPRNFLKLTDSIKNVRQQRLRNLNAKNEFTEEFLDIAQASIDYENYDLKERYSFLIRKYYPELVSSLPADFNEYRKNLDFNQPRLYDHYLFGNFIDNYLRTRSIERCDQIKDSNPSCSNLFASENIGYRIKVVDSLIKDNQLKSKFIDRLAAKSIIHSEDRESIENTLQLLEEIEYNSDKINEIQQMGAIQKALLPGNNIGNLPLRTQQLDTIRVKDIADKKPMVTYHWSVYAPNHHRWQHKRVKELRLKYPEVNFIGINVDQGIYETWKSTIANNTYDPQFEYQLFFKNLDRDLLRNYVNKLFFVDASGTIVNGVAQINSPQFERELLDFIEKEAK
ncbi:TlpA family protein disulfide reductase [Salegentibacter sp. HM20]